MSVCGGDLVVRPSARAELRAAPVKRHLTSVCACGGDLAVRPSARAELRAAPVKHHLTSVCAVVTLQYDLQRELSCVLRQ